MTHPDANKGAVVERLSQMLSIPKERIATIGDGANDVLMFRKSGFSIAMGNASDEVKEQASVVTDSNEQDGFAKAVRRYILGRGSMKPAQGTLRVFETAHVLARGAAEFLCEAAERSTGRFVVALSGGSTPKPLYRRSAEEPLKGRLPWERVHWIMGDERFVRATDPASNFGMVCDTMLSHVPAPPREHPSRADRRA